MPHHKTPPPAHDHQECLSHEQLVQLESYKLDPDVVRLILNPDLFVEKLKRSVSVRLAAPDDEEKILAFLVSEHASREPMAAALGMIPKELEHVEAAYRRKLRHHLVEGLALLLLDNDCICGLSFASIRFVTSRPPDGEVHQFKEDYGKELESHRVPAPRLNRILTFQKAMEDAIPFFLPPDVHRFAVIDFLCVQEEYLNCDLEKILVYETFSRAAELAVSHLCIICASVFSLRMAIELVLHPATHLPFARFQCDKERVFGERLPDGAVGATLFVCDVHEFLCISKKDVS
ncbi:hypothetical protein M3Y99_01403000 [Aphelenchoides fujianensis]|nr:hypothetical protein M3Y99_01403000 [Aphelenchoides fujianensis]